MLKWCLTLGAFVALSAGQSAFAQTCGGSPPGEFAIYRDSANSALVQTVGSKVVGSYIELNACLNYAPSGGQGKFYTGTVSNVFLDTEGHYLASNGQGLTDANGMALANFAPRHFGAGVSLGYVLANTNSVASQVLVQASIIDCATSDLSSCAGQPKPHLWLFQTGSTPTKAKEIEEVRDCGHPPHAGEFPRASVNGDPDPDDGLFRLYAEGLLRVLDNPDGVTTQVSIQSCLRFVPDDSDAPRGYYQGQAIAYFFSLNGLVLGYGTQNIGIGGQQLNNIQAPRPRITSNNPALINAQAGIHDFGSGVAVPLINHGDVDPHVLIAVRLIQCANDLSSCNGPPKTYYRVVNACAPDLPNFDTSRCPGIKP